MVDKSEIINWLTEPGNNFCAMPFIHMAIEGNGDLLPCCMGAPLGVNISGKTFQELIDSPERQAMIQAFSNNEQFSKCSHCWKDNTEYSPRVQFSTTAYALEFTRNNFLGLDVIDSPITWLEIKPGNRCNLKCRICGVHNSSNWAKDWYELNKDSGILNKPYKETWIYDHQKQCEWIDESSIWDNVEGLEHVNTIHIMGGEPFMIHEHFRFLKKFNDAYGLDNVKIWYNTNGTYSIPKEYKDVLDSAKRVIISVSIDDIGDRFDYQRHGSNWQHVKNTVTELFSLQNGRSPYRVKIDPCVSIYNVLYLHEFIQGCIDNDWFITEDPSHFVNNRSPHNIRSLTAQQKESVMTYLINGRHANHRMIKNTIKFLEEDIWTAELQERREYNIKKIDELRDENFADVFPEMNDILGVY